MFDSAFGAWRLLDLLPWPAWRKLCWSRTCGRTDVDNYNRMLEILAHRASISYVRRSVRLAMPRDVPIWKKFFMDNGCYSSDYRPDIDLANTPHVFASYLQGKRRRMLPDYQFKMRKGERYETWARRQASYQAKYEEPEYYAMASSWQRHECADSESTRVFCYMKMSPTRFTTSED